MKASVIIATYNRESDLVRAIKSVLAQTYKSFELIVVDQTHKHNKTTQEFLNNIKDPRFSYYLIMPPSIPMASNFGISKARGEIAIFVDDDVELDNNFIDEHIKAYDDPAVGGVAGRIKVPGWKESKLLYRITPSGLEIGGFDYPHDAVTRSGARGCNMSFRMSLLKSVGGFDTMYLDNAHRCETDLSYRIMAAGYRIVFRTKASLIHFYTPAGGSRSKSTFFRSVESFSNSFRFFYKNLNHSKRVLFNFYIINILFIIRRPNPAIMYERFRYLIEGSRKAQKELNDNSLQIKATEISVPITL